MMIICSKNVQYFALSHPFVSYPHCCCERRQFASVIKRTSGQRHPFRDGLRWTKAPWLRGSAAPYCLTIFLSSTIGSFLYSTPWLAYDQRNLDITSLMRNMKVFYAKDPIWLLEKLADWLGCSNRPWSYDRSVI